MRLQTNLYTFVLCPQHKISGFITVHKQVYRGGWHHDLELVNILCPQETKWLGEKTIDIDTTCFKLST